MNKSPSMGRAHLWPLVILCALFAITVLIRVEFLVGGWSFRPFGTARYWNGEVMTDFMQFLLSYDLRPWNWEWPLLVYPPNVVSLELGSQALKAVQGAGAAGSSAMPTFLGNIVYVSFPPGAFLFSYGVLKLTGGMGSTFALQLLSLALQVAVAGMLYALCWKTWFRKLPDARQGAWFSMLCTLPYLFAVQPLHDHVATFWAHHVFQPILLGALLLLVWSPSAVAGRTARLAMLAMASAAAVVTEWTGYLLVMGVVALFLVGAWRQAGTERKWSLGVAAAVAGSALLTALGILFLYVNAMGLDRYLVALRARALSRTTDEGKNTLFDYLASVLWSMGPFLVVLAVMALLLALRWAREARNAGHPRRILGLSILALTAFICLENLLLRGHAVSYPFDQLKLVVLVCLSMAALLHARASLQTGDSAPVYSGGRLAVGLLFASVFSWLMFLGLYADRRDARNGLMFAQTACMTGWRSVAADMRDRWDPERELLVATDAHPAEVLLGSMPVTSATLPEALQALEHSRHRQARYFITAGRGFDGDDVYLSAGRVSAEFLLSKGSPTAALLLHPSAVSAQEGGFRLMVHNEPLAQAIPVGQAFSDENGKVWVVQARADGASLLLRAADGHSVIPGSRLQGEISLTGDVMAARFFEGYGRDRMGCSFNAQTVLRTTLPWYR